MNNSKICGLCSSCSAYIIGKQVCKAGFPIPFGKLPLCIREPTESEMKRFFDDTGLPVFAKRGALEEDSGD
jgi:hypothetical protein